MRRVMHLQILVYNNWNSKSEIWGIQDVIYFLKTKNKYPTWL